MERFEHFNISGRNHDEQDDSSSWIPAKPEPNVFNDMMIRFAMPSDDDWMWHPTTTSSLQPSVSQSQRIADPALRFPEVASESYNGMSHSPSFGILSAAQWHQGDQDDYHQHFDQGTAYLPYQPRSVPATHSSCPSTYFWDTATHSQTILPPASAQATAGASVDDTDTRPLHPPLTIPWPDVFASTRAAYQDPPGEAPDGQIPQRKAKRSADDLYTPRWIRNHGTQREGWCGWCCTWFTLRDSTYWYHMHYSHGISQVDGKRLPAPAGFRTFCESAEWEIKCGRCHKWMPLPPGDRWNTAYFRHTYKCYFKSTVTSDMSNPSSPVKELKPPVRRTISNML